MGENNTVTIPMEEYKNLLEIQARANILKDYTTAEDYLISRGMIARILGLKERKINMYKEKITELLLSTNREGMDKLVEHMEEGGFFTAPCSTRYHLSKEGGLAEHSLNVYENALRISGGLGRPEEVLRDSLIIVSLLHDLGKMGQF